MYVHIYIVRSSIECAHHSRLHLQNWIPGDRVGLACIFASATKFYDFTPDVGEMFRIKTYLLYITNVRVFVWWFFFFFVLLFQFYFVRKYCLAVYKYLWFRRRVALDQSAKTDEWNKGMPEAYIARAPCSHIIIYVWKFLFFCAHWTLPLW